MRIWRQGCGGNPSLLRGGSGLCAHVKEGAVSFVGPAPQYGVSPPALSAAAPHQPGPCLHLHCGRDTEHLSNPHLGQGGRPLSPLRLPQSPPS